MTDRYQRLRDALAAGPTPGPWMEKGRVRSSGEAIRIESRHPDKLGYQVADVIDSNGYPENAANLALICAADPETIAALLAERDVLIAERDALLDERDDLRDALELY